jgi:hypothetical protein
LRQIEQRSLVVRRGSYQGESESAPFRRLGHIVAVVHDGVRGYAAVSPVEPLSSSARFAALVGSPEVTPRALRHHPGWRPRARVAIFPPVGSSSSASFVAPAGRVRSVRGSVLPAGYAPSVVHMRIVAPREVSELALGIAAEERVGL